MTDIALEAGEQELVALVSEVAADVLAAGAAQLRIERDDRTGVAFYSWITTFGCAVIELAPTRDDACPVAVSDAGEWVDISPGPEGQGTTFELWAKTRAESLELTRRCVRAVIEGGYEVSLERRRRLLGIRPPFWWFVGTFHTTSGTETYRRGPADLEQHLPLFGADAPTASRYGPHRYPAYV